MQRSPRAPTSATDLLRVLEVQFRHARESIRAVESHIAATRDVDGLACAFVQVDGVEPTNNTAERAIRPGVLWRKGSCGTQSDAGSRYVESLMTVVATLQQQQRNVLEYLTVAHEAALRGEAVPSLLPENNQHAQAAA